MKDAAAGLIGSISSLGWRVHPQGYPFVLVFAVVTWLLFFVWEVLGVLGSVLTVWCLFFFRDPERVIPERKNVVVSAADGCVAAVVPKSTPPGGGKGFGPCTRVSIFMNVFDCHMNRSPVAGVLRKITYRKGKFFNASLDKASIYNERQTLIIETSSRHRFAVVQIAGLVARRIVSFVKEGDKLARGQRFGMIRFGSRVDIYMPQGVKCLVSPGQTMVAGETVIASLSATSRARKRKT